MKVTFTLTPEDIYQFGKFVQFRSTRAKLGFLSIPITWGVIASATAIGAALSLISVVVAGLWWFAIGVIAVYVTLKGSGRRRFATDGLRMRERNVSIGEQGVHDATEISDEFFAWKAFLEITQSRNQFYLFIDRYEAVVVPKRAFPSPEQAQQFFETAMSFWKAAVQKPV